MQNVNAKWCQGEANDAVDILWIIPEKVDDVFKCELKWSQCKYCSANFLRYLESNNIDLFFFIDVTVSVIPTIGEYLHQII